MHAAELHLPSQVMIAGGCSGELPAVAERLGIRRPLIVTDPFMAEHGPVPGFADALGAPVFSGVQADPTTENVAAGLAALAAHEADGVIAVGGGSSLDTGKAVAVMARNAGTIADYAGYHRIPQAGLPLIGVPTTAGTGSEVTRVTVITDTERQVKMMLLDDHLLCDAALVDFELTLSCPRDLTAFVGVDSLTHAIESYVSAKASPVTDDWALRAAALIGANLRRAWAEPGDREARAALALGATLAGMAFSNASVALVHGMSRPIGAHFHVAHGLSNAVLLPEVTRWSLRRRARALRADRGGARRRRPGRRAPAAQRRPRDPAPGRARRARPLRRRQGRHGAGGARQRQPRLQPARPGRRARSSRSTTACTRCSRDERALGWISYSHLS